MMGDGERIDRDRRNRKRLIIGGLFLIGLLGGLLAGLSESEDMLSGRATWPPALAIGLSFAFVAAILGGGLALARQTDEFEQQSQYKAVALAAAIYMLVYPPWLFLWMGNLAPEPMHLVLFVIFWAALLVASIFYRTR